MSRCGTPLHMQMAPVQDVFDHAKVYVTMCVLMCQSGIAFSGTRAYRNRMQLDIHHP